MVVINLEYDTGQELFKKHFANNNSCWSILHDRQEYGMVGSYMEYGFPGEREGETTVQVSKIWILVMCQIFGFWSCVKYLDSGHVSNIWIPPPDTELFLRLQVEYLGSADIQRLATEATIE